jgi:hypothetical protein
MPKIVDVFFLLLCKKRNESLVTINSRKETISKSNCCKNERQ